MLGYKVLTLSSSKGIIKCVPGDDTDTIGELFDRKGLCAGTFITLRASEEAAALFTASA
jgi:hypothetical protein